MAVFLKLAPPAGADGETWTNTRETACLKAEKLLADMQADGMRDIELLTSAVAVGEGLWSFGFRHTITDVVVLLEVDGIDDYDAYCKTYLFSPKTYWNGGSDFEPQIEDFAAEGFEVVKTLRPTGGAV